MSESLLPTQRDWLQSFPPQRSLPLDQEALAIFEHAYYLGQQTEKPTEPPITFSTLALALLSGKDETSQWFAENSQYSGPKLPLILKEKGGIFVEALSAGFRPGKPSELRLSDDNQLLTASARAVLETAEEWASRVGGSDIGVRHLVAGYVLNPPAAHRKQMNDWEFNEMSWRSQFFDWAGHRYTAESWLDAKLLVAPTKSVSAFEQVKVKGAALDFPGDAQTMQVLRRAAQFHAGQPDTWLRLHTVLFALVEEIRWDVSLQELVQPIRDAWNEIQQRYEQALNDYKSRSSATREVVSFDSLDISPRVLNALETARGLARTSSDEQSQVGALQLAAAFVSRRVDSDEDWTLMGFDPQTLRLQLIDHAIRQGATVETWREALGEEEAVTLGRTVELNSDEPEAVVRADGNWKIDPLGIRPDVASFAALLAAKSLAPPLAIGLFGPWGSGKTTFLKRLRRAIDERSAPTTSTSTAPSPSPFVSNVVHVEFNAWHFAEEALVSSLVETIVRELRSFIKQDDPAIGEALANLKSEAAANARRNAEEAQRREVEARQKVALAQESLAKSEAKARQGLTSVKAAMRGTWQAALSQLQQSRTVQSSGVLNHLGESVGSLEELKHRFEVVRSRPARLLADLGWPLTIVFAIAVLVLPVLLAALANRVLALNGVEQSLTSLGTVLSIVVLWLRTASSALSQVDQAMSEVVARYESQIRSDVNVKAAEQALETANDNVANAAEQLATAERELIAAKADAAAVSLPAQMLTLISGRIEDMTYSKELTTVSTARADLQRLSLLLREQKSKRSDTSTIRAVDRVILYIDDLDRCKPQDVVRVLQVVHMLLAFELFVVVVAVDARWVEESLMQNYKWLDNTESAEQVSGSATRSKSRVTPQDYLEKIFQISFWLEPMTATRAAEYLKSLARTPTRISGSSDFSSPSSSDGNEIRILPIELDYMRALAAYVGPSPRRVKRLVNAYRLLKARLSDGQLSSFVTDRNTGDGQLRSGPYQLAIGLLVIGTGAPVSGARILGTLAHQNPSDTISSVIEGFRLRNNTDWTMAAEVLETLARTQKAKDVSEIRGWARRVGRFLLQGPTDVFSFSGSPLESSTTPDQKNNQLLEVE